MPGSGAGSAPLASASSAAVNGLLAAEPRLARRGDAPRYAVEVQRAGRALVRARAQAHHQVARLLRAGTRRHLAVGVAEGHALRDQLIGAVGGEQLGGAGGLQLVALRLQPGGEERHNFQASRRQAQRLDQRLLCLLVVHVVAGGQPSQRLRAPALAAR